MKLQQLRQIIREEISNVGKPPKLGIINLEQVKQVVAKEYAMFKLKALGFETEEEIYNDEEASEVFEETLGEFDRVRGIDDIVNILDELGFNGKEAYDFIFKSILTDPTQT